MGGEGGMRGGTNESASPQPNKQLQTRATGTPDTTYLKSTAGFLLRFLRVAATPLVATTDNKQTTVTKEKDTARAKVRPGQRRRSTDQDQERGKGAKIIS